MLASENDYIKEASNTMFRLNAEDDIRKRCQDREDYYREIRTYKKVIAEKDSLITEQNSLLLEKNSVIIEKDSVITEQNALIQQLLEENKQLKANIGE